jgi:hypothetical protein
MAHVDAGRCPGASKVVKSQLRTHAYKYIKNWDKMAGLIGVSEKCPKKMSGGRGTSIREDWCLDGQNRST